MQRQPYTPRRPSLGRGVRCPQGKPPSAVLSPPGTWRAAHSKAGLSPGHGVGQRCVAGLGGDTCTEKEFITASV